jgi:pSer/pThr/pTyr-binding forkhead associated (FHA) protein
MNERALELFRNACGLNSPLTFKCETAGDPKADVAIHETDFPFALLGRDPQSDLVLDHAQISRRHAFLQAVAGRILVVDLQSRSKVIWEGEEAPRSRGWLDQERFIQVGPYRIWRAGGDPRWDQQPELIGPSPAMDEAPNPKSVLQAALELPIRMGERPTLWPLSEQFVLVGRAPECDLVLADESVSRFHAALVPTPSGVWVVDLLAREGVHVNNERVRWAWLAEGDSFRLGSFTFILRYQTPPEQITRRDVPLEAGASVALQPGTELAVRLAKPDDERRALTVRSGSRIPVRLKTTGFSQTVEPARLVAADAGSWEAAIPFPSNPMAMWQQQMQMMESFHNDMILMVQMFVAMHREHLASVRHELDMVKRLTGELGVLQGKVTESQRSEHAGIDRPSGQPGSDRALDRKSTSAKPLADNDVERANRPGRRMTEPVAGPVAAGPKASSAKRSTPPESADAAAGGSDQVHAVLTQRIAQLQRERQGYWQRILSTITR